tara:strand:- start:3003 stop:3266 length:264 start_codon:yes stop_codon:yes gene_type:complete
MTLEQDRHKGSLARQIIDNQVFQDAFKTMENNLFDEWKVCQDQTQREAVWIMFQMMPKFQSILEATIGNGAVASKQLNDLNPKRKRK